VTTSHSQSGSQGSFELVLAEREQIGIIANLFELYAHDFSEFYPVELGADGRFGNPKLPLYWSEPDRYPFLIKVEGKLSGFALVKRQPGLATNGDVWDVGDFFIVRGSRRHGIGTEVTQKLWQSFPGPWEVRVMDSNRAAFGFWPRAVAKFARKAIPPVRIEKDGIVWHTFAFES
jgi:predicted acetyltransferase